MPAWLAASRERPSAWLAFAVYGDRVEVAQVETRAGMRPALRTYEVHSYRGGSEAEALKRLRGPVRARRAPCSALLRPGQYQMQVVEAPAVPDAELRQAVRWKLKDLLDYPVDAATVDVARIPADPGGGGRAQFVYAVSARNDQIAARMQAFHDARLPLRAIDVPEMAQRNIARLFEEPNRGLALLAFDERGGMLTFSAAGELYLSRYTDITLAQLGAAARETREQAMERLVLELQRSIDHFDRQFSYVTLARLLLAPTPIAGLQAYLAEHLYVPVQVLDLSEVLDVSSVPALRDPLRQSERLHLLGAALRQEGNGA
jgi:MSHA biogenesis protein MshI